MPIGSLGIKVGMTQIFDEKNVCIPVTLIKVEPCVVTQIKTLDRDGYNAVQLGFEINQNTSQSNKKLKLTKALEGHLKKSGSLKCTYLKEFTINQPEEFQLGQKFDIETFSTVKYVDVRGKSIGKGFAGTVKRHGFGRGPMTHGSKNHREPGSISAGSTPGRVFPGKRMAGRLGGKQTTIKRLAVLKVDQKENLLLVKGAIPGKSGNLVNLRPCIA